MTQFMIEGQQQAPIQELSEEEDADARETSQISLSQQIDPKNFDLISQFRKTLAGMNQDFVVNWSQQQSINSCFEKYSLSSRLSEIVHKNTATTNFERIVNSIIPISMDSTDSDSNSEHSATGSDSTLMEALQCFRQQSLGGLKVQFVSESGQQIMTDFHLSLSVMNLCFKRAQSKPAPLVEDVSSQSSSKLQPKPETPLKTLQVPNSQFTSPSMSQASKNFSISTANKNQSSTNSHSASGKQASSSGAAMQLEEVLPTTVHWAESQYSFNREPLFTKLKGVLNTSQQRAKLSSLDVKASWFSVLYTFHKSQNIASQFSIFSDDPTIP